MEERRSLSIVMRMIVVFTCLLSFSTTVCAVDTFILDDQHSYVLWRIRHMGFSTQSGKWYAKGTIVLDKKNPQASQVGVTINMADMVTGLPDLDAHLKGSSFFDVARFPTATFVSRKVMMRDQHTATVLGILTLHGVSKPVALTMTLNKEGINPISNKLTVGFSGHTQIKRSDFGITAYLPALGDEVTLDIEAEGKKYTQ